MNETCRKAVDKWGRDNQLIVCIEEMAELQKELCKFLRGFTDAQRQDNIAEEMADVEICMEMLRVIFSNQDRGEAWKKFKVQRLEERIVRSDYPEIHRCNNCRHIFQVDPCGDCSKHDKWEAKEDADRR